MIESGRETHFEEICRRLDCGSDRTDLRWQWDGLSTFFLDDTVVLTGGCRPPADGSRTIRRSTAKIRARGQKGVLDWLQHEARIVPDSTYRQRTKCPILQLCSDYDPCQVPESIYGIVQESDDVIKGIKDYNEEENIKTR